MMPKPLTLEKVTSMPNSKGMVVNTSNENILPRRKLFLLKIFSRDFPCCTVVKNLPANAGDTGSIPGMGRSHMTRSN